MDALDFAEIKQAWQPGGKQSPALPFGVGKSAQFLLPTPDHQGVAGELKTQAVGLNEQENAEKPYHHGGPWGQRQWQQAEAEENDQQR